MPDIIVHGPQGCGKTTNAQRIAEFFGCDVIYDDWNFYSIDRHLTGKTLALTSSPLGSFPVPRRAHVVAFDEVMEVLEWDPQKNKIPFDLLNAAQGVVFREAKRLIRWAGGDTWCDVEQGAGFALTGVYRIVVPTKPSIDWSIFDPSIRWLVRDGDDKAFASNYAPTTPDTNRRWHWSADDADISRLVLIPVNHLRSYYPGNCDWRDSLVERPEECDMWTVWNNTTRLDLLDTEQHLAFSQVPFRHPFIMWTGSEWIDRHPDQPVSGDTVYRAKIIPPSIDWTAIDESLRFLFVETESGEAFLTDYRPVYVGDRWRSDAVHTVKHEPLPKRFRISGMLASYRRGFCDPRDSLVERPA